MTNFDPMAPQSNAAQARTGTLHRVTLVTTDADKTADFFCNAMLMRKTSDRVPNGASLAAYRKLWALGDCPAWREVLFDNAGGGSAVRLVEMQGGQVLRPQLESRLSGGLSIGFPVASMEKTLARIGAQGIGTTAGIVPLEMKRPDGTSYISGEIHFRGPEDVYILAVGRPPDLAPVGPIDSTTGIGNPAYSAMVVANSLQEIAFYTEVLGWEARRNMELISSGPAGGLGLAPNTPFRFIQLFSPGASSGYIVLLDMLKESRPNPVRPRFPNRGLMTWTFRTAHFDEVAGRIVAGAGGARMLCPPLPAGSTTTRLLTALTPSGLIIEIEET